MNVKPITQRGRAATPKVKGASILGRGMKGPAIPVVAT
jgi:hypothetical protein